MLTGVTRPLTLRRVAHETAVSLVSDVATVRLDGTNAVGNTTRRVLCVSFRGEDRLVWFATAGRPRRGTTACGRGQA